MVAAQPRELFRRVSARRGAPLLLSLVAFALALPALRVGLVGDDYFQRVVLTHAGEAGGSCSVSPTPRRESGDRPAHAIGCLPVKKVRW
jgi:hypothetical protein